MKVTYDRESDSMVITLKNDPIRDSDEIGPGIIVDFGHDGEILRFEILEASRLVDDAEHVEFAVSA